MPAQIPNDIYQFSTHTALHHGFTTGQPHAADLTTHGTDGIGVFENGDLMALLDSQAYAIDGAGEARPAPLHAKLPFAMVTVFQPVRVIQSQQASMSMGALGELLASTEVLPGVGGGNSMLPFMIRGTFDSVKLNFGAGEGEGSFEKVKGTVFGFRVPVWMEGISGPTLHCHFVGKEEGSKARIGGRVRGFVAGVDAVVGVGKCGRFHLGFPQGEEWEGVQLS